MTTAEFIALYDYNYWANHRLLAIVEQVPAADYNREVTSSFGSLRQTLAHLYGAEWVWLARWEGESPTALPEAVEGETITALRARWDELEGRMRAFISSLNDDDWARPLIYTNFKGETCTLPLGQAVQHLANHQTYHRGQVTLLLRQLGHTPASTDLLYYYLERQPRAAHP